MSHMISETEMIVGVKMKLLVVFLLAVLRCSLAEGRLVTKCELRDQLVKAIGQANQEGLTGDNFVAQLVCHAQLASGFNTSAVRELTGGEHGGHFNPNWPHTRNRRNAKEPPSPNQAKLSTQPPQQSTHSTRPTQSSPLTHPTPHTESKSSTKPTPHTESKSSTRPTSFSKTPPSSQSTTPSRPIRGRRSPQGIETLYGVFQLSNDLACSDGTTPSLNICGINCSNLVDNDISDDISCQLKVSTRPGIRVFLEKVCRDVQDSVYFAECPSS